MGLRELWQSWGIEPGIVVGHSVGEYVAACVAGVYSLAEGLKLIAGRGRLMAGVQGRGAMAAVGAAEERVREALRGFEERVGIASLNGPESVVISGYEAELGRVEQRLKEWGVGVHRLKVSHGFHSPQMREMEEAFEALAGGVELAAPRLPIISSVTGRGVDREELRQARYWRRQVSEPVRFRQAMESLREQGSEVFLEVGPGTTLGVLGRQSIERSGQMWLASLRRGRGEWEQMLESLGRLYVRGAEVNWAGFDQPYARRRVPLPTYPFQRQRYWIDPQPRPRPKPEHVASSEIAVETLTEAVPADWYYEVSWRPRAETAVSRSLDNGSAAPRNNPSARHWLVVSDGDAVTSELVLQIRERGERVTVITSSEAIRERLRKEKCDIVLHLASGAEVAHGACVSSALDTAQALVAEDCGTRFWLVTTGVQSVAPGRFTLNLVHAPLWGLGKTFALEHPDSWGGLADLDPTATASQNAANLLAAIEKSDGEDQIALRNGIQYVPRLARMAVPAHMPVSFAADKTYLITGGLGGLGLKVAEWMVSHGARHLVLVSRKAPAEPATAVIEGLRQVGARVDTYAADVGSMPQMEAVFQKIRETMPQMGGIVHAAGVLDDGLVAQQTWQRIEGVMRPKVSGGWNLHLLTTGIPLDFFILFSSAASLIGSAGQAGYAVANAYLDALAFHRRASGLPALSINWGGWADVGMAARVVTQVQRKTEFQLMPPDRALAALERVLSAAVPQIGIAALDWSTHGSLHRSRPFLKDLLADTNQPASAHPHVGQPGKQRLQELLGAPPAEREIRLVHYLVEVLAPILGVDAGTIDPSQFITDLGLDSLMALEFRNRINADLEVAIPTVQLLRGIRLEEIAAQLAAALRATPVPESGATGFGSTVEYPLSFGQQVQWFGHKMMPGSASYNVGLTARACPGLEWGVFERAMGKLMARHVALRTVFFETDLGLPMQRVLPSPAPDLVLVDAGSWHDEEIREAILEDFQRPLALDQPMFRVCVFRRNDEDVVFFKFDHIIIDHWSVRVCIEDLKKIYTAELLGEEPALEPLLAEYSEFVQWEAAAFQSGGSDQHWEYWRSKLDGELPILQLPSSRQRPTVLISRGEALPLALTTEHWLGVQRIARDRRATGYSVLLAAFQVLLYRFTGQDNLIVGTSVSGRENPKWVNLMGLFINILPLRGDLSGSPTFAESVTRTRDTLLEALEHQDFPFSLLVTRLRQPRNLERIPIFQAFFNFLTDRSGTLRALFMGVQDSVVDFGNSKLHPYMVLTQQEGRPEVGLQLAEIDGQLVGYLNYNRDILDPATAEAMAACYSQLVSAIVRDPNTPIHDLLTGTPPEASDREEILI